MMMMRVMTTAAAVVAALVLCDSARAQNWGTVKGQVVWGPDKLPVKEKAKVDKDETHCLSKGDIYTDAYVVNPKNKGVRWVLVWLVDADKPAAALPIHPSLKEVSKKPLVIDQPVCKFEPRVSGIREGQEILVKNTAPVPHNIFWQGGLLGPSSNDLVPPGGQKSYQNIQARLLPIPYTCSIHSWMKGYVGVFKHPYFAVTDEDGKFELKNAPAGKYRLMLWQDSKGYVLINPANPRDRGKGIDIKANDTTDVGSIKLEPRKD